MAEQAGSVIEPTKQELEAALRLELLGDEPSLRHDYQKRLDDLDPKHRAWVEKFVVDRNMSKAFRESGFHITDESRVGIRALQLFKKPKIAEAVRAYDRWITVKNELRIGDMIEETKSVAYSNVLDFMTIDEDGLPRPDFSKATREQMAAISEVVVEEDILAGSKGKAGEPDGPSILRRKVKFKLYDKMNALDKLLRIVGAYVGKEAPQINDNRTVNTQVNVFQTGQQLTPEEQQRAYAKMLEG